MIVKLVPGVVGPNPTSTFSNETLNRCDDLWASYVLKGR